jgi:hypothetical protein
MERELVHLVCNGLSVRWAFYMTMAHLLFAKSEPHFTPEFDSVEIDYSQLISEIYDVLIWVIYVIFLIQLLY